MSASRNITSLRLVSERAHRREAMLAAIAADAASHDRDGSFPADNFTRLHAEGLLALTVGPEHGGAGAGLAETAALVGELGAACPSTALIFSMQCIQHKAIARNPAWPAHLREQVSRSAVERGALINALRVEPALGTPARGGLPGDGGNAHRFRLVDQRTKNLLHGIPGLELDAGMGAHR